MRRDKSYESGRTLSAADLELMRAGGLAEAIVARLGAEDPGADEAATRIAPARDRMRRSREQR